MGGSFMNEIVGKIHELNDCMLLVGQIGDSTVLEIAEMEGLTGDALSKPETARNGLKALFLEEISKLCSPSTGMIAVSNKLIRC